MPTNKKEHLRYRYGICLNDGCSKCKSKEVQQIAARKDLVCEECGKPLRECPPPRSFWDNHGKKIIIAACAVIAAGVIALFIGNGKSDTQISEGSDTTTDTTDTIVKEPVDTVKTELIDTVKPEPTETVKPKTVDPVVDDKTTVKDNGTSKPKSSISVPFGSYSGPANGLDGTINVTRNYSLDLRDAAHSTIELQPGDVITKTKFKNGELVGGYWQRGSEKRSFHR